MRLLLPLLLLLSVGLSYELRPVAADSEALVPGTRILALLEEPFECDFKEKIPFDKALNCIKETTKIEIFVDCDTTLKKPVKFRLPFPLPLRDVLDYLAKQTDTAWTVKNEVLTITPLEKVKGGWYMKPYYVGDLLGAAELSQPSAITPESSPTVDFEGLIEYIQTMVAPESWDTDGNDNVDSGCGKTMGYYPNLSLVIRQREAEHTEITNLLNRLRKIKELQPSVGIKAPTPTANNEEGPRATFFKGEEVDIKTGSLKAHAEAAEPLPKPREVSDVQIGYIVETAPFDAPPKDEHGVVKWSRCECRSLDGQSIKPNVDNDKKLLVRVQADSASPIDPELARQNDPLYLIVPAGKDLVLQGTVSEDKQNIRVKVSFNGIEPRSRSFHARPFEKDLVR